MKHFKLDKILLFIEGNINSNEKKSIEKHLSDCDQCFMEYSIYKTSFDDINNKKLPKPSSDILHAIESKLFNSSKIASDTSKDSSNNIINKISDCIDSLISNPIIAPAISMSLILLLILYTPNSPVSNNKMSTLNDAWNNFQGTNRNYKTLNMQKYGGNMRNLNTEEIPKGFIFIPDFKGFDIISIIDTLEKLGVKYQINYFKNEFNQTPDTEQLIMPKDTEMIINHPSPGP